VDIRFVERRQVAVRGAFESHHPRHGFGGREFRERGDFFGGTAETRPLQQLRRKIGVPIGRPDRRQVVLPGGWTRRLRPGDRSGG